MPRRYRLGQRAEGKSRTREAIVRAAVELIRAGGLRSATVPAIARAADVAPATVRNHFPDQPELLAEVGQTILEDLATPTIDIFDGIESTADRVTRLAHELLAFYERGTEWWFVLTADAALSPAFERSAAEYEQRFDRLVREAVRPMGEDPLAVAMVASVIGPPLHYALVGRGVSPNDAVTASLAMLVPWLETRGSRATRRRPRRP